MNGSNAIQGTKTVPARVVVIVVIILIAACALSLLVLRRFPSVRGESQNRRQLVYTASGSCTENRLTLLQHAGLLQLIDDQTGSVVRSQPLETINSVTINGAAGEINDTLTLDFSGGRFSAPGGIHFDGGSGGFDTLALRGGTVSNQRYDMTSQSEGIVTLDQTRVIFTNLEPIDDTILAASLTISGTAGTDSISVTDGGQLNGVQTSTVSSGGTFESVRFANKTSVIIDGISGNDTVLLNNPNPAAGLFTLEIKNFQSVSQSGALKVSRFGFDAMAATVSLTNPGNDVDILSGRIGGGVSFSDSDDLTIGSISQNGITTGANLTLTTGGALTIEKVLQVGASITLNSAGPVTQTAPIGASGGVRLLGAGPFTLSDTGNVIFLLAANTNGAITVTSANPLAIGNVLGTTGVVSNNHPIGITVLGPLTVTDTRPGADVDAGTSNVALISGRAGQDEPLIIQANAGVTGTGGGMTLRADHIVINAPVVGANSSTLTLRQFEEDSLINLGGPDGSNTLGLTDAELDLLTCASVHVGDTHTGTITVSAPISPLNASRLVLDGTGDFTATGGGSITETELFIQNFSVSGHDWTIGPSNIKTSSGNPIPYVATKLVVGSFGQNSETFDVTPSATTNYQIGGGGPFGSVAPGDTLNMNLTGTTNPFLTITSPNDGNYTFGNRQPVTFTSMETFLPAVDLSITKTDGQALTQPGANLIYIIEARNNGSLGLKDINVSDLLPGNLTNASWTCFSSFNSSCGEPAGNGSINQQANLAAGGTVTYTATTTVAASASGTITNTAAVGGLPGVSDPTPANNTATDTTSIPTLSIADVTVTEGNSGSTNAVFTVTLSPALQNTVTVDYFTANGSATEPADYTAVNGPLTFSPGQTTRNITVPVNGDTLFEGEETFFVNLMNPTGAVIGDSQGLGKITDDDASGGTLTLSASANPVAEAAGKVTITITRTGNSSLPVSVDLVTSDLTATQKSDYSIQLRTFNFGAGETTKTIDVFITDDVFIEGNEGFNVQLSNPTNNSVVGAPNPLTIAITDNDTSPQPNPIDKPTFFVRQHYIDFLNREPDAPGLAFWVNEITSCGANVQCVEVKRINVSASFYLSIEFQETGGFLIRINRAAFGKKSDVASTRLSYLQFMRDAQKVGEGVIVNQGNWQQQLEDNKTAYTRQIATSAQFVALYPMAQTAEQFVDALFASATVMPTPAERQAAISAFGSGGEAGRIAALRSVADSDSVRSVEFRPSFVLLEYLGYLRRAPTDPPDADDSGYQFWFAKLNQFNGNFIEAEMVKAFLTSIEYRSRFGP